VYALGLRFGPRALVWLESRSVTAGRFVRWLERFFARAGYLALFVSPGITVCTLAGVVRMPVVPFVVVNLAGTATLVTLVWILGDAFSDWIALLLELVRAHVGALTLVSVVGVAIAAALYWRRRWRADLVGVRELDRRQDP
jgi:membrane protein DedA with SNARE-associated domain